MSQDVANRSFLKSHALYRTVHNQKILEEQKAIIAKRLDEALVARNKLYEANQQHHLEVCDMKRQIKNLKKKDQSFKSKIPGFRSNCRLPKPVSTRSFVLILLCHINF